MNSIENMIRSMNDGERTRFLRMLKPPAGCVRISPVGEKVGWWLTNGRLSYLASDVVTLSNQRLAAAETITGH